MGAQVSSKRASLGRNASPPIQLRISPVPSYALCNGDDMFLNLNIYVLHEQAAGTTRFRRNS